MPNITLRDATTDDAAFALYVTEACMRAYAEQTWGRWNGRADFDPAMDMIVEKDRRGIGLMGLSIDSRQKSWVLEKLYLLPVPAGSSGTPGKNFSIHINPANGMCPDADEVIVSGYCFTPGNRVPFPSMELLGNNRSAACSPPGAAIQMVLVCAKP